MTSTPDTSLPWTRRTHTSPHRLLADLYMVFTSDGSAPRHAGARDGITLPELESRDSQLMVPGNRFEVLVQAPTDVGRFTLTARTADGFGQPDIPFVTVEVPGDLL